MQAGGQTETNLPTDEYFACLDGPWNGDGDSNWGEANDGIGGGDIDLTAEVYVGRGAGEQRHGGRRTSWRRRSSTRPKPPPTPTTAVFVGEKLDATTWGMIRASTSVITGCRRTGRPPIDGVVRVGGRAWTAARLLDDLNGSPHIVEHLGHGGETCNARLRLRTWRRLTNPFPFFMYSQACDSGAFDSATALAKAYVASTHGALAVVMNSRDGWYAAGRRRRMGHEFAKAFWSAVFNRGKLHLGEANQASKDVNLWPRSVPTGYLSLAVLSKPTSLATPKRLCKYPGVTITETNGSTNVTEGGATDTYTVVLTSPPTADVTFTMTLDARSRR